VVHGGWHQGLQVREELARLRLGGKGVAKVLAQGGGLFH
jgi:hypothetical protein